MKPALLLFFLFLFLAAFRVPSSALPLQLLALISLRTSLVDPYSNLRDWSYRSVDSVKTTPPPWCSWSGVSCNAATGEVTALDLSRRNLSGSIASEIRLLSRSLARLNLSGNALEGPLPAALFDLRSLEALDISHNDFNSTFPPGIDRLRYLAVFDAYSNSFTGPVPLGVTRLRRLQHLNLGGSFFQESIPAGLAGLEGLRYLHLAGNLLNGSLPPQLGLLSRLEHLELGYNDFEGSVPAELGRLSSLVYLDLSSGNLSGSLPPELGNLCRLESLFLFKNRFTGRIPNAYSALRALKVLDLSDNRLSGPIPMGLSSLSKLTLLSLMNNELSGDVPAGIGDLPSLETLLLWNNSLTGPLPQALGANGKLVKLDVSSNALTGPVPPGLCRGNRLARLILFSNRFDSSLPPGLANCTSLWRLRIETNRLRGPIPTGFGLLPNLTYADLSSNNFSGGIPGDLGNATRLELLNVSGNPLGGVLPAAIWTAPSLQIFSASRCGLAGEIPPFEFGCRSLYKLELDGNALSGSIPWDVGHCQRLLSMKLDRNRLTGIIPWELAALPAITDVDLAMNSLSGSIPSSFDNCTTLESFNISFNNLTGSVPSSGSVFRNLQPSSFQGNDGLCGALVGRPCLSEHPGGFGFRRYPPAAPAKKPSGAAIVWISAAAFGVGLVVLLAGTRCFHGRQLGGKESDPEGHGPWKLTAFQRLNFTADDVAECISTGENIIGMGSTGTVYRAEMPGGEVIAVKKLWGKQKEANMMMPARVRRRAGVPAEVEVLGSVRHRNIVRLLGCCSNRETTLLLYEYMPNGSLEDLLHSKHSGGGGKGERDRAAADWATRYKIAVGVAQGICYLHHDCDPVIVHRDLKPSNILLDAEMEARVADFGVAKLIQTGNESMSVIAGSYGYIAPEYAYTLQVDEKSDIYSYGVLLLELLSGRRSVDPAFGEGNSIVDWVRSKVAAASGNIKSNQEARSTGPWEVLDSAAGAGCPQVRERMMLALRVALLCTSRNPADRPSMRDVVSMLREAKLPDQKVAQQRPAHAGSGAAGALPPAHEDDAVDP